MSLITLKDLCISLLLRNVSYIRKEKIPADLLEEIEHISSLSPKRLAILIFRGGRVGLHGLLGDWEEGLSEAAFVGYSSFVQFFLAKGAKGWNKAIRSAAQGGHFPLVKSLVDKITRIIRGIIAKLLIINEGMYGAARGGHRDIIDFFISKGANDWKWGMYYAARGGYKDLVIFFISKGVDDWEVGLYGAALGGHLEIAKLFISRGAKNLNMAMGYAAYGGYRHLVEFFISKGADDWDEGMYEAARSGNEELVAFFVEKGANDWDGGLYAAVRGGHTSLVNFFSAKGGRYP